MRIFEGRVARPAFATLIAVAVLAVAGCASPGSSGVAGPSTAAAHGAAAAAQSAGLPDSARIVELTGASFVTDGESPRLLLSATGVLSPTVYTREDGKRVVVDLPGVVPVPGLEPPRVPSGDHMGVLQLTLRTFTELGKPHVQIDLVGDSALVAVLATDPGSAAMSVRLTKKAVREEVAEAGEKMASAPIPQPDAVKVDPVPAPAPVKVALAADQAPPLPASAGDDRRDIVRAEAKGKPATRLTALEAKTVSGAVDVQISGDGAFGYEAFLLPNPPRYVLDLAGVRNVSVRSQDVRSGPLNKVRVSQYRTQPDPVTRIVFDLNEAVSPAISVSGKTLTLAFGAVAPVAGGHGVQVAQANPVAPAAPQASSYEPHEVEDTHEPIVTPPAELPTPSAPAAAVVAEFAPAPAAIAPATVPVVASETSVRPASAEPLIASAPAVVPPPPPALAEAPKTEVASREAVVAPSVSQPASVNIAAATIEKTPATVVTPVPASPVPAAEAKQARLTAPNSAPEVRVAPKAAEPVKVARTEQVPARKSLVGAAEDRALIEAAEALIAQQEPPRGTRDLSNPYEARYMGGSDKAYTGEPITLNLKDADVKDTLQKFSDLTGLNIVLDPDVRGTVTVSLTDIPWDQALELILKINGLGYVLEGNVMRIAPTGKLASEENSRQALIKAQEQNRPLRTIIQKLSYAKGAGLLPLIKHVMSPRGDVLVDTRSNSLIIKELPETVPVVLDLIRNLDTPPLQVMIEARIVEANRKFSESLGIAWGFTGAANNSLGNTTNLVFPNSGTVAGGVAFAAGNELLSFTAANVLNSFQLKMALSMAESRGLAKIISSPKIQATQGQQASIQSGTQIPIQTNVNNTSTVTYVDATTSLNVTPFITAEGTIMMEINIQRREPIPGAGNQSMLTRDAKTQLLVRDGGTAVIGGIMKLSAGNARQMVPGLWKVPLLGNLFRNRVDSEETDELMIFITPRIMKNL